ncbi:MAG: prolyl oligopeptidase family protein [Planctomycetota bacterium]
MTARVPLLLLLFAACSTGAPTDASRPDAAERPWQPPPTRMDDVVDDYHGTEVRDPYRWLEDQDGADVAAWTARQNAAAREVLDAIPARPELRRRLEEMWNQPRHSAPRRAGQRWFWTRNDGLQNQSVVFVGDDPRGDGEVLLDPNAMSADGTVAVAGFAPDFQGQRVAFATSASGSDWRIWKVLDVSTGAVLPDELHWSKFGGAAWTHDGAGFFYQRYPAPAAGATFEQRNDTPQLCYHRVGTPQDEDQVVYERPDQPEWGYGPEVTYDGRFAVIQVSAGTDRRNRVTYIDLTEDGWPVHTLLMDFDAAWDFVGNDGDAFYFFTDKDAPNGRVVAIDRTDPAAPPRELVPEADHALRGVRLIGDRFVCSYLRDASSELRLFALDGTPAGAIALPTLGTASGMTGDRGDTALHFTFTSFTVPPTVYRYDIAGNDLTALHPPAAAADTDQLATRRVFLQSRDGTRLCMFLVHRKDLRLDGDAPCYLWGYGGFDIPITPGYSVQNLLWALRGGIYAQAVLRGGGEYGEEWHQAGMLGNKQNVFDDFVACAEYLIRNGYTAPEHLGIGGGSNGGLLVGAALTQRPDLFGAAIPEVGVLDMLRYHQFTIGWAWASEYGRSDDPEQFAWLHRYSPLHNVHPGTAYPPTLILTGDHDDRVLPGHSYKFAATLQQAQGGPAPILLRVETDAGHGAGKPVQKRIDEAADRLAFLEWALR